MRVVAMLLAGGEGTRLTVLSAKRAKPSVPFAGKFRIIDFTLSNCVNSAIFNVAVLTQYNPHSLNNHIGIGRPWDLDRLRGGVQLLQPYQGRGNQDWYRGTADAVLQNLNYIDETRADTVLVLSGDHIYKMDYREMLNFHQENDADLTVAVMNVSLEESDRFGIMSTDENHRILEFYEKPKLRDKGTLASMGIYVFKAELLRERLLSASAKYPDLDFGKHLIPDMIADGKAYAYPFSGYWVDVGTLDAYWETSMALLDPASPLELYKRDWVVHTRSSDRPGAQISVQGKIEQSMVCTGCTVRGQVIRSVISPGVYISPGAVVRESVIMNDTWIGPGAVLDRVIVDKEVVVGAGTHLGDGDDLNTPNEQWGDKMSTGITVVGKGAHIPANFRIGRNVLINSDVDEEAFSAFGNYVPSGKTV